MNDRKCFVSLLTFLLSFAFLSDSSHASAPLAQYIYKEPNYNRSIARGRNFTCTLKEGKVTCVYDNGKNMPVPDGLENVVSIGASDDHACAVDDNHGVCWGTLTFYWTDWGQGTRETEFLVFPPSIVVRSPKRLAVGFNLVCLLNEQGTVQCDSFVRKTNRGISLSSSPMEDSNFAGPVTQDMASDLTIASLYSDYNKAYNPTTVFCIAQTRGVLCGSYDDTFVLRSPQWGQWVKLVDFVKAEEFGVPIQNIALVQETETPPKTAAEKKKTCPVLNAYADDGQEQAFKRQLISSYLGPGEMCGFSTTIDRLPEYYFAMACRSTSNFDCLPSPVVGSYSYKIVSKQFKTEPPTGSPCDSAGGSNEYNCSPIVQGFPPPHSRNSGEIFRFPFTIGEQPGTIVGTSYPYRGVGIPNYPYAHWDFCLNATGDEKKRGVQCNPPRILERSSTLGRICGRQTSTST
jgi:hypothetical protein